VVLLAVRENGLFSNELSSLRLASGTLGFHLIENGKTFEVTNARIKLCLGKRQELSLVIHLELGNEIAFLLGTTEF
jgi:hypothetical protein